MVPRWTGQVQVVNVQPVGPVTGGGAGLVPGRLPVNQVLERLAAVLGMSPQELAAAVAGRATLAEVAGARGTGRDELLATVRLALVRVATERSAPWTPASVEVAAQRLVDQPGLGSAAYLTAGGGLVAASDQVARARATRTGNPEVRRRVPRRERGREGVPDDHGAGDLYEEVQGQVLPGSLEDFVGGSS